MHEGKRGLGWFQIRDRIPPGFDKGVVGSRSWSDVSGERPESGGSAEETGSDVAKHFGNSLGSQVGEKRKQRGSEVVRETQSVCSLMAY